VVKKRRTGRGSGDPVFGQCVAGSDCGQPHPTLGLVSAPRGRGAVIRVWICRQV